MKNIKTHHILAAAAGTGLVLLDSLFLEKYFFQKSTYHIGNRNGKKQLKIIHLTDLHFHKKLWLYYQKIANAINDIKPDIILITGDILDEHTKFTTAVDQFFGMLNHHTVKVAIPGNHDHKSRVPVSTLKSILAKHNCDLLINETKIYSIGGTEFAITGVDDFINGYDDFEAAVKDVGHYKNHFLLIHSPLQQEGILKSIDYINSKRRAADRLNIHYILAGHNHGGQVKFFDFAPVLPKGGGDYLAGWYNEKPPFLYLSRGVGTSTLPFRLMCRSEITLFHYRH